MSLSLSDMQNRVLEELGVIAIGATGESAHTTRVGSVYDFVYAVLNEQGLVSWGPTEAIPDGRSEIIIGLVAFYCLGKFQVPLKKRSEIENKAPSWAPFIRRLVSKKADPQKAVSFVDY